METFDCRKILVASKDEADISVLKRNVSRPMDSSISKLMIEGMIEVGGGVGAIEGELELD